MVNVDDDGIKMFGMVLIVAIILILLSTCVLPSNVTTCPEGSYSCSESPCGCCISNEDGSVDYCSGCEGYSLNEDGLCCSKEYKCGTGGCTNPLFCDVNECCPSSSCEMDFSVLKPICKPCSLASFCNPEIENSCCKDMFCSAVTSLCENCEAVKCNNVNDCCPGYECANTSCTTCERTCAVPEDCCKGWDCSEGQCINCNVPCNSDLDCCDDYKCNSETKYCEGCYQGAYCDDLNPCCPGFECDSVINKCENCERPCESDSDCCVDGFCDSLSKTCFYPDDCSNMFCSNPGEACKICPSGVDECILCKDNTICSTQFGFPFNLCKKQGNCPVGSVECSDSIVNCNCCDPITGKCMDEKVTGNCNSIDGCTTCSCKSYEVLLCPQNNVYCPGKGCYNPTESTFILNYVCHTCSASSDACCTPLVPSDAIPNSVVEVGYDVCLSGYKIENECVFMVSYSYDEEVSKYIYRFNYGGQSSIEGISKYGPSEVVISSVKISDEAMCNSLPDNKFTQPKYYKIG